MDKPELVRLLKARFRPQEMRSLVRDLGEDPDDIRMNPQTVGEFAWEIVEYFSRLNKLQALEEAIERSHGPRAPRARRGLGVALLVALGLGGALGLGLIFVMLGRAQNLPVELQAPQIPIPPIPLPEGSGGVLVGVQSISRDALTAHADLCSRLKEQEGRSLVRCLDPPFLANDSAELRRFAKQLGASLVVTVDPHRAAHIIPMGSLEENALLAEAIPSIDLATRGAAEELSPVLLALSAIASTRFDANKAACLRMPRDASGPVGLLTVYTRQFSTECITDWSELDALKEAARCSDEHEDEKRRCALAKYLFAERCPDCLETPRYLLDLKREFKDVKDDPYKRVVELKLARSYCKNVDTARKSAGDLIAMLKDDLLPAARGDACFRATLTWIADCALRAAAPGGEIDAGAEGQAFKRELEGLSELTLEEYEACPDRVVRSTALEWRAFGYALAGDWSNAAKLYKAAAAVYNTPDRHLGYTEALLHLLKPRDAYEELRNDTFRGMCAPRPEPAGKPDAGPVALTRARASIRYAALGWVAVRQTKGSWDAGYARCLVTKNDELPEGEPAIRSEDAGLKDLLRKVTGSDLLYENLRGENSAFTRGELKTLVVGSP